MSRLLNPNDPQRLTPPGDEARAYILRAPTVYDRALLRRACLARGARPWSELDMLAALAAGVRQLIGEDSDEARSVLADIETRAAPYSRH